MSETEKPYLIEEIRDKYRGQYVATRVTERDDAGQPLKAIVVSHHIDKHKLRDEIKDEKNICIFYAGPIPKAGYVVVF